MIQNSDFSAQPDFHTTNEFHEHDEGALLTGLWDSIVRLRGSIIQRRTPEGRRALSLYVPLLQPED